MSFLHRQHLKAHLLLEVQLIAYLHLRSLVGATDFFDARLRVQQNAGHKGKVGERPRPDKLFAGEFSL